MSRFNRSKASKPVEYESSPANPIGVACVLLKCGDLYTLSITSISVFYEVISNIDNLKRLNDNFPKLCRRILDVPSCSWLLLMLYAAPHTLTLKLLEELVTIFSAARKLPKGLGVRGSRGKAHLSPDDHASIVLACKEAIRLTLVLSGKIIAHPLESRSPVWLLELKLLSEEDVMQCALSVNSLLYELEINPKRMLISHEVSNIISSLGARLQRFEKIYMRLHKLDKELKDRNKDLLKARRDFSSMLYEVAHVENEEQLDIPIDYYLKENDDMKWLYEIKVKRKAAKDKVQDEFVLCRGHFDVTFSCIRCMCILVSRVVAMYTGLHLDTTSLVPLGTDSTLPSTRNVSAALYPTIYGGNSSAADGNASQKDALVTSLLREVPWDKLASIAYIERRVSGTVCARLLAATACKLSDILQCRLVPWAKRALDDIVNLPRWYPVIEDIPDVELPDSPRGDIFDSNFVDDTPRESPTVFFRRPMTVDTRISTALAFWASRGNRAVSSRMASWKNTVDDGSDESSLWSQVVVLAENKSEIIMNADEYYNKTDPSRTFREMDLKNKATVLQELDVDNSDSDSDSESMSGDSSVDVPHSEDGISLEPRHNKVFKLMVRDDYAMAVLHLSATEFPDENSEEFDLYKDGNKICKQYIHEELYGHMDKLLKFSLEGPAGEEINRFNHPLQIVTSLIDQDCSRKLSTELCCVPPACMRYLLSCCQGIRPCVVDIVVRSAAMSVVTSALGGSFPWFIHPSEAPCHEHVLSSTQSRRQQLQQSDINSVPHLKLYRYCESVLVKVVEEFAETLYYSRRQDFLPLGENGRSHISRILRLFAVVADINDELIRKNLVASMEKRLQEKVVKDQFWPPLTALGTDVMWLAPFVVLWQGGVSRLVWAYRKSRPWRGEEVDDELFGNSVYRCNNDICRNFTALLATLCSANDDICLSMGDYATVTTEAMLTALQNRDRPLCQQLFRLATCIVNAGKTPMFSGDKFTTTVPFDAPATYFRILFFQEGNALDIACEMLIDSHNDIWGIDPARDEKQKSQRHGGAQHGATENSKTNENSLPQIGNCRKRNSGAVETMQIDSDEKLPAIAGASPRIEQQQGFKLCEERPDACEGVQKDDSSVDDGWSEDDDGDYSVMKVITEWDEKFAEEKARVAKDFALFSLECIVELCESRLELQDRVYEKSPGLFHCLYGLLTPKKRNFDRETDIKCDVMEYTIASDGSLSLGNFRPHMGIVGATAKAIRVLVRRHAKIRTLVRNSGCVVGLIDALDMSYAIDDKVLGIHVVTAIEQLIIRNVEAWDFVKSAAGMKGLLQLCHMGNAAVRIIASTEIISRIHPVHDRSIYAVTEDVLNNNGLSTIIRMLHSNNGGVQTNALTLLRSLCVNKLACRRAVLTPEFIAEIAVLLFSPEVSVVRVACEVMLVLGAEDQFTLRKLVESMESSVAVLEGYDTGVLDRYTNENGTGMSISARLMDIVKGVLSVQPISETAFKRSCSSPGNIEEYPETLVAMSDRSTLTNTFYTTERITAEFYDDPRLIQELVSLSNLAANVLAGMTDSEEANWPDGGAPLRHTMKASGLLPGIGDLEGRKPSDGNILNYKAY